ncbi:MAG: T9SS type A sorting domain-containing protein [Paludibacteraceae bacterium]|nr:T9SS type A sorting domain-containing protein [Paludibacteraceae bacterium]
MKKLMSLLIGALCLLVPVKMWSQDVVASISFNSTVESNHITLNPNGGDCEAYLVQYGGQYCLEVRQYAYFKVDHSVISSNDHNLIIRVTYYDGGTSSFGFQYNAITEDYRTMNFNRADTPQFVSATVAVQDAALNGRQNGGCDFRFSGGFYLKKVEIMRGTMSPAAEPIPNYSSVDHSYSEFTGKTVAGYQGWFRTSDRYHNWGHYDYGSHEPDGTAWPRANHISVDLYPYVWEYDDDILAQTGFQNLGGGQLAKLFDSNTSSAIDTHFRWMREYGVDGAAVQRFVGNIGRVVYNNGDADQLAKIKHAAEANNRIFYVMYDISGGRESDNGVSPYVEDVEFDWVYNVEQNMGLTSSPAYANVGGKPVVCIWGLGVGGRPTRTSDYHELIDFFHNRGCYVIIGTSGAWRRDGDEKLAAYAKADMLSPWFVGAFKWDSEIESAYLDGMPQDIAWCDAHNVKYQSVIFSGFSWALWTSSLPNMFPRNAGEFFWYQAYLLKQRHGLNYFYIAMFDEYDEGTAIAKMASDYFDIPQDQYFVTGSADGYWVSQDFQLRVAGAAINMVKGNTPLVRHCPVQHSLGPVYYRNSFESKYVQCVESQYNGYYPVDPCFKNPSVQSSAAASQSVVEIRREPGHSGDYVAVAEGKSSAGTIYYYKIADVRIPVKEGMKLSFWKMTLNELGRYAFVDLVTAHGHTLRDNGYRDQNNSPMHPAEGHGTVGQGWERFECQIGQGIYVGDTIRTILIAYDHSGDGNYSAMFDDILIEDGELPPSQVSQVAQTGRSLRVHGNTAVLEGYDNAQVCLYDLSGRLIQSYANVNGKVVLPVSKGIYLLVVRDARGKDSYKLVF